MQWLKCSKVFPSLFNNLLFHWKKTWNPSSCIMRHLLNTITTYFYIWMAGPGHGQLFRKLKAFHRVGLDTYSNTKYLWTVQEYFQKHSIPFGGKACMMNENNTVKTQLACQMNYALTDNQTKSLVSEQNKRRRTRPKTERSSKHCIPQERDSQLEVSPYLDCEWPLSCRLQSEKGGQKIIISLKNHISNV